MWSEFSTGSDTDVEDRREFWGETDNTTESNESAGDSDDREEWTGGYWDGGEQPWDLGGMGAASIVGSGSDSGADDDYRMGMGHKSLVDLDALASAGVFGRPQHSATLAPNGVLAGMHLQHARMDAPAPLGPPPNSPPPPVCAQRFDAATLVAQGEMKADGGKMEFQTDKAGEAAVHALRYLSALALHSVH